MSKRLILILNPMHPNKDANSILITKLLPYFSMTTSIVSMNTVKENSSLPSEINCTPVTWVKRRLFDSFYIRFLRLFNDGITADDKLCVKKISRVIRRQPSPDFVISTFQMHAPCIVASRMEGSKKALYLMDPTEPMISDRMSVKDEPQWFLDVIINTDIVFTTPFILNVMKKKGYESLIKKIVPVYFPMVSRFENISKRKRDSKTHMLFCGKMYFGIRSPACFINLINQLDENYEITFMGNGCEEIPKHFNIVSSANVSFLPSQCYEDALQAMADADILINIGNSIPVHMPSKTLEYINTGKPIINFYKIQDCPTLYFTKRYPLCLNIYEREYDLEALFVKVVMFCREVKGKRVSQEWIQNEYIECTPKYITSIIEKELENI